MSFTVEAVLNIRAVLRIVLYAVRIKLQKEIIFLKSSALLYDQIISPRTISSSIEMPESGYNISTSFESDMCQRGTVYILAHFEKDFSRPQTKLREGIVFTGVCLFTGRKEG